MAKNKRVRLKDKKKKKSRRKPPTPDLNSIIRTIFLQFPLFPLSPQSSTSKAGAREVKERIEFIGWSVSESVNVVSTIQFARATPFKMRMTFADPIIILVPFSARINIKDS